MVSYRSSLEIVNFDLELVGIGALYTYVFLFLCVLCAFEMFHEISTFTQRVAKILVTYNLNAINYTWYVYEQECIRMDRHPYVYT